MTDSNKNIYPQLSSLPIHDSVLTQDSKTLSHLYELYFSRVQNNINATLGIPNPSETINPDYNFIRTKGLTPTTQADGDDAEFVEQWNVVGATGGNMYTLTPTAYPSDSSNLLGSKNYVNVSITAMPTAPIYFYNVNYSSDFNTAFKYQEKNLTFSAQISNNTSNRTKIRFSVYTDGTGDIYNSGAIFLDPGLNKISKNIQVGSLNPGSGSFSQLRVLVDDLGGASADFDLQYVKVEFGENPSLLGINHTLEKIRIDNL